MENRLTYTDLLGIYKNWWSKRIRIEIAFMSIMISASLLWHYYLKDVLQMMEETNDPDKLLIVSVFWGVVGLLILLGISLLLIFDKQYLFQALDKPYSTFSFQTQKRRVSWTMYSVIMIWPIIACMPFNEDYSIWPHPTKIGTWLVTTIALLIPQILAEMIISLPLLGIILRRSKKFTLTKNIVIDSKSKS